MMSERVRLLRKEAKLTQVGVSEGSAIPWRTYQEIEAGKNPSYDTLLKLANFFNVSMDYLAGRTEDRRLHR